MLRRPHSTTPPASPRISKKAKLDHLSPDSFKNGVFLAPMVRSGALPTRLFALKHGANLVWGPEIVDKAILNAERVVDPVTGVVSYNGKQSRAMFTTHPIEKPYLIYQIGSADPDLAVRAAKTVMQDVSGIDLNCGCPKPFSTHAGMGAALLTNPDLLCSILTALREAMPPEVTVTAKIRLLPTQEDTLQLVKRIVECGVSAITVHCRTRNMRPREKALVERLREIVDFVESLGKGIAVIENGDCVSFEDAKRIREITGAHSVMIATAAEANPSCFSPTPLNDLEETLIPAYMRLSNYFGHHWGLTKFCVNQFKAPRINVKKSTSQELHKRLSTAKGFDAFSDILGPGTGEDDFREIEWAILSRCNARLVEDSLEPSTPLNRENPDPPGLNAPLGPSNPLRMPTPAAVSGHPLTPTPCPTTTGDDLREIERIILSRCNDRLVGDSSEEALLSTPLNRENPEPPGLNAPLGPSNPLRMPVPAAVSGHDALTPTPGGGVPLTAC